MVSVEDGVENSGVLSFTDHSGADKTLSGVMRDGNHTTVSWILCCPKARNTVRSTV